VDHLTLSTWNPSTCSPFPLSLLHLRFLNHFLLSLFLYLLIFLITLFFFSLNFSLINHSSHIISSHIIVIYYIISQCVAYLLCLVALIHLKPKGFASLSFLAGNDSLLLAFLYTHAPISKKERKKNLELVSFFFKYPLLNFDVLYSKFLVFRHVFPAQNLPQLKFSKLNC